MLKHETAGPAIEADTIPQTLERTLALNGLTGFVNAGGRGTRLHSLFAPGDKGICKAMLQVGQPPITLVEHQVNKLDRAGVPTIVVDVGDHPDAKEYVQAIYGDRDNIHVLCPAERLESGGGPVQAIRTRPELFSSEVFICCVDVLLDIDESDFLGLHREKGGSMTIALTTASNVPNQGAYYVNAADQVIHCAELTGSVIEPPSTYMYRGSSTGAIIANVDFLESTPWQIGDGPLSLYRDDQIIPRAIEKSSMFAFDNGDHYFADVGTVASWRNVTENYDTIAPYLHYKD